VTSESFESLQAQDIEYSKRSIAIVAVVTIALAVGVWFLGHHAFALSLLFLIPASCVDARERLLPEPLILPALGAPLVYASFSGHAVDAAFGAGLGISFLMILFYVRPGSVGLGDVKLLGAIGAGLGPEGLVASSVFGAVSGILMMWLMPRYRAHGIPMGPLFVGWAFVFALVVTFVPQWSFGL
jgi:prepilin signal peptidase PulO-like enzyme (type II secretory pathway)